MLVIRSKPVKLEHFKVLFFLSQAELPLSNILSSENTKVMKIKFHKNLLKRSESILLINFYSNQQFFKLSKSIIGIDLMTPESCFTEEKLKKIVVEVKLSISFYLSMYQ